MIADDPVDFAIEHGLPQRFDVLRAGGLAD